MANQIDLLKQKIYFIRGYRVMLDSDLAALYKVPTKQLNLAVKRNFSRFPIDFMFQLNEKEYESLRFQIETLEKGKGKHRKYLPYVFSEQGVSMLSSVLHSETAIRVNIAIMRAFVKLRELLENNKYLAKKIEELEKKFYQHDENFEAVFKAIKAIIYSGIPINKKIKGLSKD